MLLVTLSIHFLFMVSFTIAFHPYFPDYRCIETGECEEHTKRDDGSATPIIPTLKLRQRLPMDDLPHSARIRRYLERLTTKYEMGRNQKRENNYSISQSKTPTLQNSFALDQDGTDFSYFAEVQFGSSSTPLWMLMDTGASSTWVMGTDCASPSCESHNTYGSSNSSSLKSHPEDFAIGYGTGQVAGMWAADTIKFAGLEVTLDFGIANTTSDDFLHFPFDGIMGLATNQGDYPPALTTMKNSKILKSNIFGINLDRHADGTNDGEMSWGVIDPSKFSGDIAYSSLTDADGGWGIKGDGAGIDSKDAGISTNIAYIDTGTSYIFIPAADAKALHSLVDGSQPSTDGSSWQVPCDTKLDMQFTFGTISYSVPSVDWVGGKSSGSSLCTSNIYPGEPVGAGNWLLGDTFMKNVYSVFDSDNSRIGFGKKAPPPSQSTSSGSSSSTSSVGSSSLSSTSHPSSTTNTPSTSSTSSISSTSTSGSGSLSNSKETVTSSSSGSKITASPATNTGSGSQGFNAAITSKASPAGSTSQTSSSAISPSPTAHGAGSQLNVNIFTTFVIVLISLALGR